MDGIILFADNDPESRETWGRVLTNKGYDVRLARNPQEARDILQRMEVDVAILDLRLVDDTDENDVSGLLLAGEEIYRQVPKIILTAFQTGYKNLRDVLGPLVDGLPPAIAFVHKDEGPQALIEVIQKTYERWPHLRLSTVKVSEQIKSDHEGARRQSRWNYLAAFILSILGSIIIFAGISLAWFNQLAIGIVGTSGGIVVEILSYLFFSRVNSANERMDVYHKELLQTYWFEFLLAACEELPSQKRIKCETQIILTATKNWLEHSSNSLPVLQNQKNVRKTETRKVMSKP
jgi:CheY-like chemotaxis protein